MNFIKFFQKFAYYFMYYTVKAMYYMLVVIYKIFEWTIIGIIMLLLNRIGKPKKEKNNNSSE